MVDTHCHIYKEYYDNIDELIKEIKLSGVDKIIVNGCDIKSNLEVLELINRYDFVYGALGFHPTELESFDFTQINWLEDHVTDEKIVAIGEIGLDYHYDDTDKVLQNEVLRRQLEIAEKYNKPVIIHSRDAIQDTYDILKKYKIRGTIHCFSGSVEMAREFVKLGFLIGVGGVVTYKNAKNLVNVINDIGLEYVLLETDSPYLSPEPLRGQKNTPCNLPIIALKIANLTNNSIDEVVKITTNNALELFDF